MIPVYQTRTGNNSDAPGNCFSACVASILECALAELPDEAAIVKELKQEHGNKWEVWTDAFRWRKSWAKLWDRTQAFCMKRGFFMLEVHGPFASEMVDAWCIISADSPRNLPHAVVGRGLHVVHDPYPEGGGVSEHDRTYIFFVLVNPAAH